MNVVGIIAEYNPFHNGHLYHLEQAKKITNSNYVMVVMSPNFVQRGAPAITDKWTRTKMALECGADVVIELPTPYATASAEFFAYGSVALLHHTGIVDSICFGSESNNIDAFKNIARIFNNEPLEFQLLLKKYLSEGITFPKAREKALVEYCNAEEISRIISSPNNILSIEYIKALYQLQSSIIPTTIQRVACEYHDTAITQAIASATAIRNECKKENWDHIGQAMPHNCYEMLSNKSPHSHKRVFDEDLSSFLCYRLLFSSNEDIKNIVGVREGIENRIFDVFHQTHHIEEMVNKIKTKRFTQTAIQRILLHIILQITKDDFFAFEEAGGPQYIRVLGFRKSSEHLLTQMSKKASLPMVMNVKRDYDSLPSLAKKMMDIEIRSTNIYTSLQKSNRFYNLDFTQRLIII